MNLSEAELEARFSQATIQRCHEVAQDIVELAQETLIRHGTFDTGELLASMHADGGAVKIDADYWLYVEHGTGIHHSPDPHTSWTVHNAFGRGITATYQGNKPQPFLAPTVEEVRARRLAAE